MVGKITLVAGVTQLAQSGYTLRKELSSESHTAAVGTDKGLHKTYTYDNAGRLGETREYYALGTSKQVRVREADGTRYFVNVDVGGWLRRTEKYYYEADGSLRLIDEFARVQGWAGAYADTGNGALDAAAILAQKTDTAVLSKISAQAYFGADFRSTYDLAGRVAQNFYHHVNNAEGAGTSTGGFITTYTHTYVGGEGWLETQVTGDVNVANYRDSSMTSRYDAWGRRVEMTETTPLPDYQTTLTYKRYFSYDLDGGVLSRRDGDWKNNTFTQIPDVNTPVVNLAPDFISNAQWTAMTDAQRRSWMAAGQNQRFVYSNGQQVARLNEAGKLDVTTAMTAFDSSSLGSSMVAVNDGDTLQSIAQRTYGNASLWYILAEANAVTDSQLFTGQMLKAPDVTTNKNDSTTFKPYNPAEIMGPTEPGTPYIAAPPAQGGNNCAMMIVMIVAVVVTAIVAPYMTGIIAEAMGGVVAASAAGVATAAAGGFVGGMAGSIASQVVGKALGVVDHFSLRSAVSSGIATGMTAGLSAGFGAGAIGSSGTFDGATIGGAIASKSWGTVAALAVGNAASSYVGNKIAGIQGTTFSWKSIAATAAGSVITSGITNQMGLGEDKLFRGFGKFSADFAGGMVGSVVSLHVRRAAGFDDKVDYRQIAMDVFGNALGNAVVRGMQSGAGRKAKADWARAQAEHDAQLMMQDEVDRGLSPAGMGSVAGNTSSLDTAQTFALGTSPGAALDVSYVPGYEPQANDFSSILGKWHNDFEALRTTSALISGKGYDLAAQHNDIVDRGKMLLGAFGHFLADQRDVTPFAKVLLAIQDRDSENPILKAARLDPSDLSGMDIAAVRSEIVSGLAGTIEATYRVASDTRAVIHNPFSYLGSGAYGLLDSLSAGGGNLGHTSLAGDIASMVPLAGSLVSAGQIYAMELDKRSLGAMASMGMISPAAFNRAIGDAGYEQNLTGLGLLAGGAPGKLGKLIQGGFVLGTPSNAEASRNLSKIERGLAREAVRAGTLTRYLSGELQSAFDLGHFKRGDLIEDLALQHVNPVKRFGNFKTIDEFSFATGHALSLKSVDLQSVSRLNPKTLERLLTGYVDEVSAFSKHSQTVRAGGVKRDITITANQIRSRELLLGYNPASATPAQLGVMQRVASYAAGLPNPVIFNLLPVR